MGETNKNRRVAVPSFRKDLGIEAQHPLAATSQEDVVKLSIVRQRITRAQRIVRKYVKPGVSLVDELIRDRRAEARRESKRNS